ncbi:MAG: glycoside hydrolase family 25 protein [Coriobacteriia bacterium]|nr:glycoside hydrolase family 25 protein [Coriobacteriia bacterium]
MKVFLTKGLSWGLALILCVLLALLCFSCKPDREEPQVEEPVVEEPAPTYVSPYDWSCLFFEDGRFVYKKDWVFTSLTGIDVSEHQGEIDWDAVALDGIDFAIIRVGHRGYSEGETYLDEQLYANIEGAHNAGIKVGVYFFSQAINEREAIEEAEVVIRALEGIPIEYPVFYDYEPIGGANGRANYLTNEQLTLNTRAFCERIEAAGYVAMIYGNKRVIGRIDPELRDRYGVWFAEYEVMTPSAQFDFIIWQYSSRGSVAGIHTNVDMNIHFLSP